MQNLDILLLRAPTPLLPFITKAAGALPIALLLVGDNLSGVDEMKQPFWRKELIRLLWRWNKFQQIQIAKQNLTFVNSHKLYEELKGSVPQLFEIRTTTLSQNDFFEREDTCGSPPYHLLYTGRIERAKGLLLLVETLALLIQEGNDLILDLVGWAVPGDPILDELFTLANQKGIQERVIFHGFKPLGAELSEMYKSADLYVIASHAEGFPRTIWEAMANSVPVVATRVGSIPHFIEGAAELVTPNSIKDLVSSIKKMLYSPDLRKNYIQKGFVLAKENTLEVQSAKMMTTMKEWIVDLK
ncbi:MAG: glycosyltransferase [Anaerolineales bacterium]